MNIIQSWRQVLKLAKPSYGSLFVLVTLKSIKDFYILFLPLWWWISAIIGALIVCYHGASYIEFCATLYHYSWPLFDLVYAMIWLAIIFIMVLMARPSIKRKNYAYVQDYHRHFGYFCLFVLFLAGLLFLVRELLMGIWYSGYQILGTIVFALFMAFGIVFPISVDDFYPWLLLSPIPAFFLLFFVDSWGTFHDFWRAIKRACLMFMYTYPVSVFIYVVHMVAWFSWLKPHVVTHYSYHHEWIQHGLIPSIVNTLVNPIVSQMIMKIVMVLFFLPIAVCFWTTIYFKYVHEQIERYSNEYIEGK